MGDDACDSADNLGIVQEYLEHLYEDTESDFSDSAEEAKRRLIQCGDVTAGAIIFGGRGLVRIAWAAEILELIGTDETKLALRQAATDERSLQAYFGNCYFAALGEEFALRNLNTNYFQYGVPSFEWAAVVQIFGTHRFYDAASNIAGTVNAAYMGLADASIHALYKMYPDSVSETQIVYERLENREINRSTSVEDFQVIFEKQISE